MELQTLTFIVVGITFAIYIGIAFWARAGSTSEFYVAGGGVNPVANGYPCSVGSYFWGGLASTLFWVDPKEELIVVFMTQLIPSSTFNFRGQLESLVYAALQ